MIVAKLTWQNQKCNLPPPHLLNGTPLEIRETLMGRRHHQGILTARMSHQAGEWAESSSEAIHDLRAYQGFVCNTRRAALDIPEPAIYCAGQSIARGKSI